MKIENQIVNGGYQQFADKINNKYANTNNDKYTNSSIQNDKILKLIMDGKHLNAIDKILILSVDEQIKNDCILIKSQLLGIEKDVNMNLITYDTGNVLKNKLTQALINLYKSI